MGGVLLWDRQQIQRLAKVEFGVAIHQQYAEALAGGLTKRGATLSDVEYEAQLTVELVLSTLEKDIGRKPKRSQDDIQTDASLDT